MAGIDGVGRVGIRNYVAPVSLSSIVTNGLVLNLDAGNLASYPGTGTVWTDLSGNGNNATLINGTSYSSANGGALAFDGINDYVDLGDKDAFDGFGSYSLSAWVYINSFRTYNAIFHKWGGAGYSYFLGVWSSSIYAGENYSSATGGKPGGYGAISNTSSIQTGRWYNIVYTSTVSNISVYIDGVLDKSQANPWRGGNIINGASSLKLGTHIDGGEYTDCRIANSIIYNRELSASEVLQNFNSTKSRFGFASYTARTAAFATATGITDTTILNALNTFDTGLISNGLETKMKALYPFVGGTANTHKFNFMDARDADAAFRLQFNGGWVHSSTGVKGNGTNTFVDTYLNASTNLNPASTAFSIYKRLNETTNECYLSVGPITSQSNTTSELFYWNGSTYFMCSGSSEKSSTSINKGFYMVNRDSNTLKLFKNTSSTAYSDNYTSHYNANVIIGGIGGYFTNNELSFSHIGSGLSDSEEAIFYTLVHAFQTSLSRAV